MTFFLCSISTVLKELTLKYLKILDICHWFFKALKFLKTVPFW